MAGVHEAEKIVPKPEEKTTTEATTIETPKETVHKDDSAAAVEVEIKDEEVPKVEKETEKEKTSAVEIPAAVEKQDVKPAAKEEKTVEVKTA